MSRLLYNKAIIDKLSELIDKFPEQRFGQLLVNSGIIQYKPDISVAGQREDISTIDPFYEESELTWKRMCNNQFCFPDNS